MLFVLFVLAFLLACADPSQAQNGGGAPHSSGLDGGAAGMGALGAAVQAGNRDCPPRGSPGREISVPSAPGALSCAPTGSGPATGYPPTTPPSRDDGKHPPPPAK